MRRQSFPPLPLLFALASVLFTPSTLHAQPSSGIAYQLTDPVASSASDTLPPNSPSASHADGGSTPLPNAPAATATQQIKSSLEALNGVLERYRQVGNRDAEAHALGAIASSYNALRQQQKAVEIYQAELNLWRALGDKKNEATTLGHMGDVYRDWGFPDQAIHFYRDALKTAPTSTSKTERAAILNNMGLAYFALHDKKKCVEYLEQSLSAYRAAQDREGEAHALTNLGSTYGFLINDPHKAIDYFQQAVTQLELLNDRSTEADALELMGGVWRKLQKQDMAVESFNRALVLYERTGNVQGEASVRRQLSAVAASNTETIASAR
jgi:tetratricopeptide (TPR) repeat protein